MISSSTIDKVISVSNIDDVIKDFVDFKLYQFHDKALTPVNQSEMILSVCESISKIPDKIKQFLYIRKFCNQVRIPESLLLNRIGER